MTVKSLSGLLTVLMILAAAGCGDNSQPGQQRGGHPPPSAPAAQHSDLTPRSDAVEDRSSDASLSWPFISEDPADDALAKNPLTKNYFLIFDGSGSMRDRGCSGDENKIDVAKRAVVAWAKSVPADANLGLYAFDNNGWSTLPLAVDNREAFMQTINQIEAGSNTPLTRAMEYAYEAFSEQGRRQLGYGDYTIVVVTDGIANYAEDLRQAVNRVLAKSPINIYSIGFCIGDSHSLNQPGNTVYKAANNPEQLEKGLQEVLAESEFFDEDNFSN